MNYKLSNFYSEMLPVNVNGLVSKKCLQHCGMRRAWPDGLCHATEEMCCLAPHSPIWAGKAPLARPSTKTGSQDWDDL